MSAPGASRPGRIGPTPEAVFLRGARRGLTLWYTAVLIATLVVLGSVLYFGQRDLLLRPVIGMVREFSEFAARDWQQSPDQPCQPPQPDRAPPPPPGERRDRSVMLRLRGRAPVYVACLDAQGGVVAAATIPGEAGPPPEAFLVPSLLPEALRVGTAEDRIDGGEAGPIYRVARTVSAANGSGVLGVVIAGRSVAEQVAALAALRSLLFGIGGIAVLVATGGSLLLANRALRPARLAFARQQAFIADASHELRTPLTLIRANADVLLRGRERLDQRDAELVEDIISEVGHMDRLTTNLLILARLDAGQARLNSDLVDLSSVAARAVRRLTPLAREKRVTVAETYAPGVVVLGDAAALEDAALILVDNAIKHTPEGGQISVLTRKSGGTSEIVVEDTGEGIPAEHLPRLGQRFYRADKARSRELGGAGLGLSIAFAIAAAHGGSVKITSTLGQGTSAVLALPGRPG